MKETPLPADMSLWPLSPFELLGVGQSYGIKELKKAYSKLIRFYKPEHYPAEFARIREAYDRLLPWASSEPKIDTSDNQLPPPREVNNESSQDGLIIDENRLPEPIRQPENRDLINNDQYDSKSEFDKFSNQDSDYLWQKACRGEIEAAYKGLIQATIRSPLVEKNYLRLFWLVSAHPLLEEGRFPAHWLESGISATGGSQRLLEVFATYLSVTPEAASGARFAKVLDQLRDPYQYANLVQIAWRQLLKHRRWRDVYEQFHVVRERLISNSDSWLSLVRMVADYAGWEMTSLTGIDLMKTCVAELKELNYLALQRPDVFDRFDFLKSLVKSAVAIGPVEGLGDLARIIQREWASDLDEVRADFQKILAKMARFPNRWSNRFDEAGGTALPITCQAFHLAQQLRAEGGEEPQIPQDEDFRTSLARKFKTLTPYQKFRDQIVEVCLETFYSPESLAEIIGPRYAKKFPQESSLEELVAADWPVRLICLAHRFYHS